MAKRSPILGYNHNVKYRGLIFHVQTEDSGLLSPHLFTHLFYGGVIISTRKLVYDSGSAEDAIKGLMQSQHKIVLKDLKGGKFDDKIDQYLVGTEGLEPRATPAASVGPPKPIDDGPRPSDPEIVLSRPETDHDIEPIDVQPIAVARTATPPPIPQRQSTPPSGQRAVTPSSSGIPIPRTQTAERKSAPTTVRTSLSPPPLPDMSELDPPTDPDATDAMHAAMQNATVRTPMPDFDSAPEIQILQSEDSAVARTRSKHDTEVSDGIPGSNAPAQEKRPNALAAGALPPARPITRPPSRQAMSPPAVMSRPLTNSDGDRSRHESDAVEVYAPAPPSVDPPPGMQERPGQYAQHKRVNQRSVDVLKAERERAGAVPIPAGLARPGRAAQPSPPPSVPQRITREPTPNSNSVPQRVTREPSPGSGPRATAPTAAERPAERPRTPTPARISPPSANVRAPSSSGSGGVVMTRPAVIVGAPSKPNSTPPRVRKAREEEGRGFGQGLISEKSLDEVILAYLSEDADEK
ncbi:MAG: hypothetical protein ACKV2T_01605 [Kofleriaceae bacterium]